MLFVIYKVAPSSTMHGALAAAGRQKFGPSIPDSHWCYEHFKTRILPTLQYPVQYIPSWANGAYSRGPPTASCPHASR